MRDVLVCLPGIAGSVLRKDGRDIWNTSGGALFSALATLGGSIRSRVTAYRASSVEPVTELVTVLAP